MGCVAPARPPVGVRRPQHVEARTAHARRRPDGERAPASAVSGTVWALAPVAGRWGPSDAPVLREPQAGMRCQVRCGGCPSGEEDSGGPGTVVQVRSVPTAGQAGAGIGPCQVRCGTSCGPADRPRRTPGGWCPPGGCGTTPVGWRGAAGVGGVLPAGGRARRDSLGGRRRVRGGGGGLTGGVQACRTRRRRGGPARREGLVVGWRGPAGWCGEQPVGRGVQKRPGASPAPNTRLQPTPYSLRSAPASRRG